MELFRQLSTAADPKETPFKSKYEARRILEELRNEIELADGDDDIIKERSKLLAVLDYYRGINHTNTEEATAGERLLSASLQVLKPLMAERSYVSVVLDALIQLGVLWFDWGSLEKQYPILRKPATFTSNSERVSSVPPLDIIRSYAERDHIEECDDATVQTLWEAFEVQHTHTTYYLAQIYGALKLQDKSAEYCLKTLQRQIQYGRLDKLSWALDCMTLSQYYSQHNAFSLAYECLSSSEHMLSLLESECSSTPVSDSETETDPLARAKADLAWIWGKFYLLALSISVERKDRDLNVNETVKQLPNDDAAVFPKLQTALMRARIPQNFARSYDKAKLLFLEGITTLTAAKDFLDSMDLLAITY
ncbi:KIF-1 binding protein C terminal-domain-containing protein [Chytridium lagenaria]|nr:KIF-1 binding protein C terminal-domain-containing protein [Chytridium lagenaria]